MKNRASILTGLVLIVFLFAACSGGGGGGASTGSGSGASSGSTLVMSQKISVEGSIGDGPVTGAAIKVYDANGNTVNFTGAAKSDDNAKYSITIPDGVVLPIKIVAEGGKDAVTGDAPVIPLESMITATTAKDAATAQKTNPGAKLTTHVNPFTTVITTAAANSAPGGLAAVDDTQLNAVKASITKSLNFGLPTGVDPFSVKIDSTNAPAFVKANEALGEFVKKVTTTVGGSGSTLTTGSTGAVIKAISGDIVKSGVMDGSSSGTNNVAIGTKSVDPNLIAAAAQAAVVDIGTKVAANKLDVTKGDGTSISADSAMLKLNSAIALATPGMPAAGSTPPAPPAGCTPNAATGTVTCGAPPAGVSPPNCTVSGTSMTCTPPPGCTVNADNKHVDCNMPPSGITPPANCTASAGGATMSCTPPQAQNVPPTTQLANQITVASQSISSFAPTTAGSSAAGASSTLTTDLISKIKTAAAAGTPIGGADQANIFVNYQAAAGTGNNMVNTMLPPAVFSTSGNTIGLGGSALSAIKTGMTNAASAAGSNGMAPLANGTFVPPPAGQLCPVGAPCTALTPGLACPTGTTSATCAPPAAGTVTNGLFCPAGAALAANGTCTTSGTTINAMICPAGTTIQTNGTCTTSSGGTTAGQFCPPGSTVDASGKCATSGGQTVTVCAAGTICPTYTATGTVSAAMACPAGTAMTAGACITATGAPVPGMVCPPGSTVSTDGSCKTSSGGTTTGQFCPPGTTMANGACTATGGAVNVVATSCPAGTMMTAKGICSTPTGATTTGTVCAAGTTCAPPPGGTAGNAAFCPVGTTMGPNGACTTATGAGTAAPMACPAGSFMGTNGTCTTSSGGTQSGVFCPPPAVMGSDGKCTSATGGTANGTFCPAGSFMTPDGKCSAPGTTGGTCPPGFTGTPPACVASTTTTGAFCQPGTVMDPFGKCVPFSGGTTTTVVCNGDPAVNGGCPTNVTGSATTCPAGMTGVPPQCVSSTPCPAATPYGMYPNCQATPPAGPPPSGTQTGTGTMPPPCGGAGQPACPTGTKTGTGTGTMPPPTGTMTGTGTGTMPPPTGTKTGTGTGTMPPPTGTMTGTGTGTPPPPPPSGTGTGTGTGTRPPCSPHGTPTCP